MTDEQKALLRANRLKLNESTGEWTIRYPDGLTVNIAAGLAERLFARLDRSLEISVVLWQIFHAAITQFPGKAPTIRLAFDSSGGYINVEEDEHGTV